MAGVEMATVPTWEAHNSNESGLFNTSWLLNDTATVNETCGVTADNNTPDSFLNVSKQYPVELAVPLYGYAMPVLLLVTTLANTIIVAVLWQPHMRSPTNSLLMAMALSDMLTVVFPEPVFFYMYTLQNHARPLHPPAACYAWVFLNDLIPNLFHTASIWLTVALAVQRYIYVCHPSTALTWCTIPRVKCAIVVIFVLAAVHQAPRFVELYFESIEVTWGDQCVTVCGEAFNAWLLAFGLNIYFPIYFGFRLIFVHLGPCTVLVVINVLLYRAMKEAQRRRRKLLHDKSSRKECGRLRDTNHTTLMLIVVVSVFLVTEIPLAIITALHILNNAGLEFLSEDSYDTVKLFFICSNSFIIFSYPINFAIYCGMSRQFRETFCELFLRDRRGSTGNDSEFSAGGTLRSSVRNGPRHACRSTTSETII